VTDQTKARILGVHTVGVPVRAQDRAPEPYVGTLGFDKAMDVPLHQDGNGLSIVEV
jgi:hypothetical protein